MVLTVKFQADSVGAAALSLLIWPGIGQAVNKTQKKKMLPTQF